MFRVSRDEPQRRRFDVRPRACHPIVVATTRAAAELFAKNHIEPQRAVKRGAANYATRRNEQRTG
jgi:hypothetical protein